MGEFKAGMEPQEGDGSRMGMLFEDVLPAEQQRTRMRAHIDEMRSHPRYRNSRGPPLKKMPGDVMLFTRSHVLLRGMASGMNITLPIMDKYAPSAREGVNV